MKRKISSIVTLFLTVVLSICFFACQQEKIEVYAFDFTDMEVGKNVTLLDIMEEKKKEGTLTFSVRDGMVVEIGGLENTLNYNPCWMLYTTDEDYANHEWGTYEYNEKILGSATVGAELLLVKTNEIYVWVYQSF